MALERIDVHAHYIPDFYREALEEAGIHHPDGIRATPAWSEALHLEAMQRLRVAKSYLSISSPGVYFGDTGKAASLARAVNEEAFGLRTRNPGRFGFFASAPVPDISRAEAELVYALDELQADGLVLETNTDGVYLGDPRLDPLYAQLDARGSTLFIHPTTAHGGEAMALGYPRPMLEFPFETTRAVTQMILSGVLERFPAMRVIVPHAGAALPILANRIELLLPFLAEGGDTPPPSVKDALRRLHFDLAGAPVPELLTALLSVTELANVHYGSDFPFTPLEPAARLADILDATQVLTGAARAAIYSRNSELLFPNAG